MLTPIAEHLEDRRDFHQAPGPFEHGHDLDQGHVLMDSPTHSFRILPRKMRCTSFPDERLPHHPEF
jgi:hypothetical protein